MPKMIEAKGVVPAWLQAAEFLLTQPSQEAVHLFVSIEHPTAVSAEDKAVISLIDRFLVDHSKQPIDTVADTIFPKSHYLKGGLTGVLEDYPKSMQQIYNEDADVRKHWPWGTYAMRMLRLPGADAEPIDQLKATLRKLAKTNMKSCFEISGGPSFVDTSAPENVAEVTTYSALEDRRKPMGLPCLSHLSFTRTKAFGQLHLNATYRSHYYVERALGNYIGLAGLLAFMAHESEHDCGSLALNSTFAKLDTENFGGKGAVKDLLKRARSVYNGNELSRELADA